MENAHKIECLPADFSEIAKGFAGSRYDAVVSKSAEIKAFCDAHYDGIVCCLLVGSCSQQADGPLSDVDLIIIVEAGRRLGRRQIILHGLPLQITSMTLAYALEMLEPHTGLRGGTYIPAFRGGRYLSGSKDVCDLLIRKSHAQPESASPTANAEAIRYGLMSISIYLLELIKQSDDRSTVANSGELMRNVTNVLSAEAGLPPYAFGDPKGLRGDAELEALYAGACRYIADRDDPGFLNLARRFLVKRNWSNWAFDGEIGLR